MLFDIGERLLKNSVDGQFNLTGKALGKRTARKVDFDFGAGLKIAHECFYSGDESEIIELEIRQCSPTLAYGPTMERSSVADGSTTDG